MDAIEAIHSRRSVRDYKDRPLEREVIEALVWDAAQAPPPAIRDLKRWAFVVVEGVEQLGRMGEQAKAYAPVPRRRLARFRRGSITRTSRCSGTPRR